MPADRAGFPECAEFTLVTIAAGDSIYFSSARDGRVVCLDASTGEQRWQFIAGAAVNRAPMFWEGRIYCGSSDGFVYCLDADDGALQWRYSVAPAQRWLLAYGKMTSAWPVQTDVLVDEGVAYCAAGVFPHAGTFVYALDARTGRLLWRNGSQAEDSGQITLAPGGHLYLTKRQIWVPKDFHGFSAPQYGAPVPFRRSDGHFESVWPDPEDPEVPKLDSANIWVRIFWPLHGVVKNGVRYTGQEAWKTTDEHKTREYVYRKEIPGRWTDFDSGAGVRIKGSPVIFRYDPDLSTVVHAGDTVFHAAFDRDPEQNGTGCGIYARDPASGTVRWSTELPERANQVLVANGRLVVATRTGKIYCYASAQSPARKPALVKEQTIAQPFAPDPVIAGAADQIVQSSGITEGYALIADCESGQLALELARRTDLYICALFRDGDALARARKACVDANMHLTRIVAYHQEEDGPLPFPSYWADLIVSERAAVGGELPANHEKLLRMQKPIRGLALIGGAQEESVLGDWVRATGMEGWRLVEGKGRWVSRIRPPLAEGGRWTHMYGDAGNTACSDDGVLKAPIGVVWYGTPHVREPGTHTALVVNGVLVVPEPNALEACDQYTGRRLWRKEFGSIGVSLAASPTHVYARVQHVMVKLDLLTGEEVGTYLSAFGEEHGWGWFAVSEDGKTIYGAAGGGVFATEMESGQGNVLWTRGGPEVNEEDRIGGLFAMEQGRIYVLGGKADEGQRKDAIAQMRRWLSSQEAELREEFEEQVDKRDIRELSAIDAGTGKILYRRGVDVSNCGGAWLRGSGFGGKRGYNPHVGMGMYCRDGVVVIASESGADKGWGMWNSGAYGARAITAIDGTKGELLWYKFTDHRTRPVIVGDAIHAEPWAYGLRTGEKKTRLHPITGEEADWAWCRPDKQCGIFSASRHILFGRNKGFGYHDLIGDEGLFTFWHSRSNCHVDHVSGGGLMIKPPQAIYCKCPWSLPFTVAMGQVATEPVAAPKYAQPGRTLPVKHLRIDFGATGDRKDDGGGLWIGAARPRNHKLLLGYDLRMVSHEGAYESRRSAKYTTIEGARVPFVFATAQVGIRRCILPVARTEDGNGRYTVRLGFAALPGDTEGQRVFDVLLNGVVVLRDFDPHRAAGGSDRAVWKEFSLDLERELIIDFRAAGDAPSSESLPLINAVSILRESMHGPALDVPPEFWMNEGSPGRKTVFKLGNLVEKPFRGVLKVESPVGFSVEFEDDSALVLPPGGRMEVPVTITGSSEAAPGLQHLLVKLADEDGREVSTGRIAVEWLGKWERVRLPGSGRSFRSERLQQTFGRLLKPNLSWESFEMTTGMRGFEKGDTAVHYLSFHFPKELRGLKIGNARLRLQKASAATKLLRAIGGESPPTGNLWGTIRRLDGPPWPDWGKVNHANLPQAAGVAEALAPSGRSSIEVSAKVPGDLQPTDENPDMHLVLEASAEQVVAYYTERALDPALAPALVVDYLPGDETETK